MKRMLFMLTMAALMAACTGCWGGAPEPTAAPTGAPTAAATAAPTVMPASTDALPTEGAGDAAPLATAEATPGTVS